MSAARSSRTHLLAHSALRQLAADSGFEFSLIISGLGTLSSVNEQLLRCTLNSRESLLGKPFSTLVRRPDGRPFGPAFLHPRSGANPQRKTFLVTTRDGRTFTCRGKAYYFAGTKSEPGGALLVGDRIRPKSPARGDFLADPDCAALVISSLRDGLCVVDERGTIVSADARLAGMAGLHPADLIGVGPPYPWMGDSENRRLSEALGEVARTGTPAHLLLVLEREEGPPRALSFSISPLPEGNRHYLASVRDISDVHPVQESQMAEKRIERLKQQVRRNAERLKTLADVNRSVLRSGSLREIFRRITECVGRLVDHDLAGIYVFDGEDKFLQPCSLSKATSFSRKLGRMPLKPGEGIVGSAALSGETVMVNDAQCDPRSVYPPGMRPETEHIIAAPLRGRRSTYGIIAVARNRQPGFHDEDAQIVQSFADAASIAIDNLLLDAGPSRNGGEARRGTAPFRPPLAGRRRNGEDGTAAPGEAGATHTPLPGA